MSPKKSKSSPKIVVSKIKTDLRKKEPPLVDLKVANPVTYLKSWWKRVMSNEGIDFRFKVKPLTAIAISIVIATCGFGLGRFALSVEKPYISYVPTQTTSPAPIPAPTLSPWRETAFSGELKYSKYDERYYLITNASEAINLEIPEVVDLSDLIGRRIFAAGSYNQEARMLRVTQASNLEVLPLKIEAVPIISITPTAEPTLPSAATSSAQPINEF